MKKKLSLLLMMLPGFCMAQNTLVEYRHNLDKLITLNIKSQTVSEVLNKMSKAGDFYFSYNGKLFNQDSVVNISMRNKPVRDVLDQLFTGKVDYKEVGEHVILRYAANHFTIEPENITNADRLYLISGYVVDTETGRKVKQASVYEKRLLQSTLTDDDGYFKLRFKGDHKEVILTASKENYRDTSLVFLSDIKVKPEGYTDPDDEKAKGFLKDMGDSGFGRFLLSSKQKIQGLNIPDFFANTPFQASLTPGLSSHGSMSSQVINKFSLNVLGGYTAGVNGFEIAGLFNITRGDVKKFQAAGLYNGIGGSVDGFQMAGLANDVRTKVNGVQAAGLINHVREDMDGVQIAGLGNITSQRMKGMQIAGLFNYAKEMKGVQIGLVNINGNSTGYSIGLINYSRHGYHKISIYANETINTNIAIKTGNSKLYNIILAGKNFSDSAKIEAFGLGFGHDFLFSNKVSLAAELSSQLIYLGNWDDTNTLARFQTNLQVQVTKGLIVFGGPAYSLYWTEGANGSPGKGYSKQVEPSKHHSFSTHMKGWVGWNVGVTLF